MKKPELYSDFYKKYFAVVYRYVLVRVGLRHETEDIVQTVFFKIYRRLVRGDATTKLTAAYLFMIVRHVLIDYFKKHKELSINTIGQVVERESLDSKIFENLDKDWLLKLIVSALKKLSYDQREVIIMKFINDLSNNEIAKILNKTEENIRQIQCRAIKALRDILIKERYI